MKDFNYEKAYCVQALPAFNSLTKKQKETKQTVIINPWKSPNHGTNRDYNVDKPVFEYGDYRIYHLFEKNWLYTYKNMAFNELAGLNKQHLINVANRNGSGFLYWRAIENLKAHGLEKGNKNEYLKEA